MGEDTLLRDEGEDGRLLETEATERTAENQPESTPASTGQSSSGADTLANSISANDSWGDESVATRREQGAPWDQLPVDHVSPLKSPRREPNDEYLADLGAISCEVWFAAPVGDGLTAWYCVGRLLNALWWLRTGLVLTGIPRPQCERKLIVDDLARRNLRDPLDELDRVVQRLSELTNAFADSERRRDIDDAIRRSVEGYRESFRNGDAEGRRDEIRTWVEHGGESVRDLTFDEDGDGCDALRASLHAAGSDAARTALDLGCAVDQLLRGSLSPCVHDPLRVVWRTNRTLHDPQLVALGYGHAYATLACRPSAGVTCDATLTGRICGLCRRLQVFDDVETAFSLVEAAASGDVYAVDGFDSLLRGAFASRVAGSAPESDVVTIRRIIAGNANASRKWIRAKLKDLGIAMSNDRLQVACDALRKPGELQVPKRPRKR